MDRLSYGEKKALTALRNHGPIVCRRIEGGNHSENGTAPLGGFSIKDVESLVNQGFAKKTQVTPDMVFHVTGPGMSAEY